MPLSAKDFHINISYIDMFPNVGIEETIGDIESQGLIIKTEKREPEAYAALEWIVPTAIVTYIAKPYFEAFLSEAGKDHYLVVKKWAKKIAGKCKNIAMKILTSTGTTEKLNKSYTQSLAFSIVIKTKQNRTIKLLFDTNLDQQDWEHAIDLLFDYVIENYERSPNDRLTEKIKELNKKEHFSLYAIIGKEGELLFYDDNGLMELQTQNERRSD